MKITLKIFTYLFCIFFCNTVRLSAQNIDSLKLELTKTTQDTTKCILLSTLAETASPEEWPKFNDELFSFVEKKLNEKINNKEKSIYKKYYAKSINNKGFLAYEKEEIEKALEYWKKAIEIATEINEVNDLSSYHYNIGSLYDNIGNIKEALSHYEVSLKYYEKMNYKPGIASVLNNIGIIYDEQNELEKAIINWERSTAISLEINDQANYANSLLNLGFAYKTKKVYQKSLDYYNKALEILKKINKEKLYATALNNIGGLYDILDSSSKALYYWNESIKIYDKLKNKDGLANTLNNIGGLYMKLKDYKKAEYYLNNSMMYSKELGYPFNIKSASEKLWMLYKIKGNSKLALENYEIYIKMRDSLSNIETQKATIKQQTQYEYDKKKALADKEHELQLKQQEEKSAAEKAKQNIIIASVSVVLLLVAVFSIFLYNRFKVTQRQKAIIEVKEKETHEQKLLIEEKHKEITDSINYAERIQRSFLATQSHLDGNINPVASSASATDSNYFIFFQPKDVVSGDFYWSSTLLNGNFALATADSTGHGVPGAIMSLLNITSLEKAIETETSPDRILNTTRNIIIERLKKDGSADGGKDGMDCSVCVYDFKNKKLFIAAAHNPVWIARRLDTEPVEVTVIEIKPDKMPVGKHDRQDVPFTLHEINLQEGDVVYTLTDGFPDQFGGEKGKKYMSKNLRELLAANAHLPMPEQKELLQKTFSDWKGSLEQIDDVTVIGIRI